MPAKGRQEFIDQVCESFKDDDEMALIARDRITTIVTDSDSNLHPANENLANGFFSSSKNRIIITIILLLISIGSIGYHFSSIKKWDVLTTNDLFFAPEWTSLSDRYTHLNEEEKFILFGDPEAQNQLEVAESRWQRYPENASYYIEYLEKFENVNRRYPDDMVAYGDEIDPQNSLYRLNALAEMKTEEVVTNKKNIYRYENETREEYLERRKKEREERKNRRARKKESIPPKSAVPLTKAPTEPEMVIRDQEKFNDALVLFFEAADKKNFSEHINTLMKERIPLLNTERETLNDHMIPFLYISHTSSPMLNVMRSNDILIAEAQRCGREKDVEALKKLIQAHEKISKQLVSEDNVTLVHALVARAYIHGVLPHFRDAAATCDLPELEKKYGDLFDAFEKDKMVKESAPISAQIIDVQKYGSAISSIATPLLYHKIRDQSVISPVDHEPLRKTEHAIFSRFTVIFGWGFCVLLAVLFCFANRFKNKTSRILSKKLLGVLHFKDWLLVLLVGIILPIALFYYLDRFSPWKITAYNAIYEDGMHSALRSSILIILLLCSQTLVLEWRLGRVIDKVFGKQNVWLVWVALILALVPLFTINTIAESSEPLKWYMTLGSSLFLLMTFVFLRFLPGLFSYKNSILSRAIVLSLIMSATLLTFLIPVYKAEERHWIAKDELLKLSPDRAAFSKLEGEVTNQFVKETRDLMGW